MSAPDRGFALMKFPQMLARAFESSPFARNFESCVGQLRDSLPHVRPENYRGIGRYPINADYDYPEPGWQWSDRPEPPIGERLALAEALGVGGDNFPNEEWLIDGPWLIPDLACAKGVADLLESQNIYEIIEVARYPSRTDAASIGFDVGWWASGNFSLICDTAVWPIWHPAPPDAMTAFSANLSLLNEAVLFPDVDSAVSFRDMYRAQPWAETEDSAFEIVEIAPVEMS
jgi:hypothetical protein